MDSVQFHTSRSKQFLSHRIDYFEAKRTPYYNRWLGATKAEAMIYIGLTGWLAAIYTDRTNREDEFYNKFSKVERML